MVHRAVAIRVHGQVQGVGYRYVAKQRADALGLTGFVRNELDGTVYLEIAGSPNDVAAFIVWCHEGSPWSRVDRVEVRDTHPPYCVGFEVR